MPVEDQPVTNTVENRSPGPVPVKRNSAEFGAKNSGFVWNIKTRMIVMAGAAAIGLSLLAVIQLMSGSSVSAAMAKGDHLRQQINTISSMRLASHELVLAAMDART